MRILIIGGGPAAVEAAIAARQTDRDCEIMICSRESQIPYRRVLLPALLAEDIAAERFFIHPAEYYTQHNIKLKLDMRAEKVDLANKNVTFSDGTILAYDRLIAASGSSPNSLPQAEKKIPNLFYLHDAADAYSIRSKINTLCKVAIIGSGVLGLETASALLSCGCRVYLIERHSNLMSGVLDKECSGFLRKLLQHQKNLTILTDCMVLNAAAVNNAIRLDLKSSATSHITPDIVICATGLHPDTIPGLPQSKSGYIVDEFMQISGTDSVYAAGDCTSCPGSTAGCYQTARLQGRIAGINAASGKQIFTPPLRELRSSFMQLKLYCAGSVNSGDDASSEYSNQSMQKLYWKNDKLTGAVLIGDVSRAGNYSRLLNDQLRDR